MIVVQFTGKITNSWAGRDDGYPETKTRIFKSDCDDTLNPKTDLKKMQEFLANNPNLPDRKIYIALECDEFGTPIE